LRWKENSSKSYRSRYRCPNVVPAVKVAPVKGEVDEMRREKEENQIK
jgi:hypothetical protein